MEVLNREEIDAFWIDGYLLLEDAVPAAKLAALSSQFNAWVDESRSHAEPFGSTLDGRPRFDVEPGHSAEAPALRRIASIGSAACRITISALQPGLSPYPSSCMARAALTVTASNTLLT